MCSSEKIGFALFDCRSHKGSPLGFGASSVSGAQITEKVRENGIFVKRCFPTFSKTEIRKRGKLW